MAVSSARRTSGSSLAGPSPLFIFRPAHYLKQFHKKYNKKVEASQGGNRRGWAAVHNREDNMYQFDNPRLPTLQPWMNTTKPPADRNAVDPRALVRHAVAVLAGEAGRAAKLLAAAGDPAAARPADISG